MNVTPSFFTVLKAAAGARPALHRGRGHARPQPRHRPQLDVREASAGRRRRHRRSRAAAERRPLHGRRRAARDVHVPQPRRAALGPARVHRRRARRTIAATARITTRSRGSLPASRWRRPVRASTRRTRGTSSRPGPLKSALVNAGYRTEIRSFAADLVRDVRAALQMLWGGVACLLLIAAVNITNLSLARATGRREGGRHASRAGRGQGARRPSARHRDDAADARRRRRSALRSGSGASAR